MKEWEQTYRDSIIFVGTRRRWKESGKKKAGVLLTRFRQIRNLGKGKKKFEGKNPGTLF